MCYTQFDPAVTGPYSRYSQNYARVTHLNLLSEWQADPNFVKCLKVCTVCPLLSRCECGLHNINVTLLVVSAEIRPYVTGPIANCSSKAIFRLPAFAQGTFRIQNNQLLV